MAADYDLIVVGAGAAGLVTAAGGAGLGARVALVERHRMGGECLWTGCVPSKALLACARAAAEARTARNYGVHASGVEVDFAGVMRHVRDAQRAIEPHDSPERFRGLGVDVLHGTARFVGDRTLRVDSRTISGRHVVIATGSRPAIPPIPGIDSVRFLTNETIFDLEILPAATAVLGGGAVGVELGQALALLGSRVTIIESAEHILPREDPELAAMLAAELTAAGVSLKVRRQVQRVASEGARVRLHLEGELVDADALLIATSRESILDTLDLSAGGVAFANGALQLDRKLRTTANNVWAAGDVTGGLRFTHVADYQARLVLRNALFPFSASTNYDVVPRVTYSIPELARVGLTEAEATQRIGRNVRVWARGFHDLDRAVADGRTNGLLKIISDPKGRILGGHILGHHASSMIAEIALAMRENIPLSRVAATLHAYPTYAEAIKQSADAFMRSRLRGFAKTVTKVLVRHS